MSRFDGKIVVITDGISGIGVAAACEIEAERAQVVVNGYLPTDRFEPAPASLPQ
jgi:NADP-dependent 3-hydroxy acid dehydrogenase YdfG